MKRKRAQPKPVFYDDVDGNVRVEESTIPGAGKGLKAVRPILKHETITYYGGRLRQKPPKNTDYVWGPTPDGKFADAAKEERPNCRGRYINCARNYDLKRVNASIHWDVYQGKIVVVAVQDIPEGDEIFIDYGQAYWDARK
jgi:SET domain